MRRITDREFEIMSDYALWDEKISIIAAKHGITPGRIRQIIEKVRAITWRLIKAHSDPKMSKYCYDHIKGYALWEMFNDALAFEAYEKTIEKYTAKMFLEMRMNEELVHDKTPYEDLELRPQTHRAVYRFLELPEPTVGDVASMSRVEFRRQRGVGPSVYNEVLESLRILSERGMK